MKIERKKRGLAHVARPGDLFSSGWYYQLGLKVDL